MNIPILEIIGLTCTVDNSTNKELVGITGKIINESKNMLILDTKFGEKLIPKKICTFKISNHNDTTTISGTKLYNRSHERLEVIA